MEQTSTIDTYVVKGLEVCDLNGTNAVKLPILYTREEMPVSTEDVPTQEDVDRWPYLRGIKIPDINSDVGLLIGTNAPLASEPWDVVHSQDDGPYAVKTLLGWAVRGPLRSNTETVRKRHDASVNRCSVCGDKGLEMQVENYFRQDFNERTIDDRPENSVEDHIFMKTVTDNVQMKEGHYQIPLPFKQHEIEMPNNRSQAEHCAMQLKRRLIKNPQLQEDYKAFVDNLIQKGYARKVPQDKLGRNDGKVWYIPHHGVYHAKKPNKIRVVFNCSARYRGTSLNEQLLQGPDLANPLVAVLLRFRQEPIALMADIEAMFHQVRVTPDDSDVLRFLWWPDGDMNRPLEEFQMTVHLFGAVSSPSCANFSHYGRRLQTMNQTTTRR